MVMKIEALQVIVNTKTTNNMCSLVWVSIISLYGIKLISFALFFSLIFLFKHCLGLWV